MTDEEAAVSKELSRRAFLKKMAAVGFAVPVVTSFALDGIASASGDKGNEFDHHHPNMSQSNPNQFLYDIEEVEEILEEFLGNQHHK